MKIIVLPTNCTLPALCPVIVGLNELSEPFQVSRSPIGYSRSEPKATKQSPFYAHNNLSIIAPIN